MSGENYEKVAHMFGVHVADTLAAEGLITPDTKPDSAYDLSRFLTVNKDQDPTHWRVTARPGAAPVGYPAGNLRKEFRALAYTARQQPYISQVNGTVPKPIAPVSVTFDRRPAARTQATSAKNTGLQVTIENCVLVPLTLEWV